MEEREYSVLEIVKVNFKNWKILLCAMLIGGIALGLFQFMNAKPVAEYYYETSQMNASFYMKEYSNETITERYLSVKALGGSYKAYELFKTNTGYELTYDDYLKLLQFSEAQYIDVQEIYFAYPETYGGLKVETEEQAVLVMGQLMDSLIDICNEYVGVGNIVALDNGYTTIITHYETGTPTSRKDVLVATCKGAIAGAFFGFILAFIFVSLGYMIGTVTKTADEIRTGLGAPILGFIRRGKNKEQEIKKVQLFFERETPCIINFLPFAEKNFNGAKDLADSYTKLGKRVCYLDCSSENSVNEIADYISGRRTFDETELFLRKLLAENDYVIIKSPDLKLYSDGYRIAKLTNQNVICCRRRSFSGTELCDVKNTFTVNELQMAGAVVYGN